jgi:phosphate uptake regulator
MVKYILSSYIIYNTLYLYNLEKFKNKHELIHVMKRKIIQLAGKTLVVSLPSKWVKKYGVKKGDEIEVDEQERKLVIKAKGEEELQLKLLNLKDLNHMVGRIIGGFYKSGYNELEITYDSPEQYAAIREVLNRSCMGYEIIRHGQRTLLIKNLSELHTEEFDNLFRRLFLSLLSSAEDTLEYAKQGNLKALEEIELRDLLITKYSDLCRRMINIHGRGSISKTTSYYYLSEALEKIGDGYKAFANFLIKNNMKNINTENVHSLFEINALLRLSYDLLYTFDFKKLEEFGQQREKIKKEFESKLNTASLKELKCTHLLFNIFSMIFEMNSSIIIANV